MLSGYSCLKNRHRYHRITKRLPQQPRQTVSQNFAESRRLIQLKLSRNYFRNNSKLAESAWSKHFGTFEEFKRAANVIPSRHARGMETAIARHASVDAMRLMNEQKRDWSGNVKTNW